MITNVCLIENVKMLQMFLLRLVGLEVNKCKTIKYNQVIMTIVNVKHKYDNNSKYSN